MPPVPHDVVMRILHDGLTASGHADVASTLQQRVRIVGDPLGTASIGHVVKALVRDDDSTPWERATPIAVKIVKPNILESLRVDKAITEECFAELVHAGVVSTVQVRHCGADCSGCGMLNVGAWAGWRTAAFFVTHTHILPFVRTALGDQADAFARFSNTQYLSVVDETRAEDEVERLKRMARESSYDGPHVAVVRAPANSATVAALQDCAVIMEVRCASLFPLRNSHVARLLRSCDEVARLAGSI